MRHFRKKTISKFKMNKKINRKTNRKTNRKKVNLKIGGSPSSDSVKILNPHDAYPEPEAYDTDEDESQPMPEGARAGPTFDVEGPGQAGPTFEIEGSMSNSQDNKYDKKMRKRRKKMKKFSPVKRAQFQADDLAESAVFNPDEWWMVGDSPTTNVAIDPKKSFKQTSRATKFSPKLVKEIEEIQSKLVTEPYFAKAVDDQEREFVPKQLQKMNVGELKRLADDLSLFSRQALPRKEYTKNELINLITSDADNKDILTAIVDAGERVHRSGEDDRSSAAARRRAAQRFSGEAAEVEGEVDAPLSPLTRLTALRAQAEAEEAKDL